MLVDKEAGPRPLVLGGLSNSLLGVVNNKSAAEQYSRLVDAVVLITESTHTARLHQERRPLLKSLPHPPHGKGTQDVPMAHDEHVTRAVVGGVAVLLWMVILHERRLVLGADGGDQPVQALGDLLGRLAAGAAIPPDVPVLAQALFLPPRADLFAGDALVVAVVPLADVLGDLDARIAGQARGVTDGAVGVPG